MGVNIPPLQFSIQLVDITLGSRVITVGSTDWCYCTMISTAVTVIIKEDSNPS